MRDEPDQRPRRVDNPRSEVRGARQPLSKTRRGTQCRVNPPLLPLPPVAPDSTGSKVQLLVLDTIGVLLSVYQRGRSIGCDPSCRLYLRSAKLISVPSAPSA